LEAPQKMTRLDENKHIEFVSAVLRDVSSLLVTLQKEPQMLDERINNFFERVATHFPLMVEIGGKINIEASVKKFAGAWDEEHDSMLKSKLEVEASVNIGYVSPGIAATGTVALGGGKDEDGAQRNGQGNASSTESVATTTTARGGFHDAVNKPDFSLFMKSLRVNSNWRRLKIEADGLTPIWSLLNANVISFPQLREHHPDLEREDNKSLGALLEQLSRRMKEVFTQKTQKKTPPDSEWIRVIANVEAARRAASAQFSPNVGKLN